VKIHLNNQDKIINNTEGIFLVDAGAGTGKTFTLVKRYLNILESGAKPKDILLVTFTVKAANEMKTRLHTEAHRNNLFKKISYRDFVDAPITTFHAFCSKVLKKYGRSAPVFLGIKDTVSPNFRLIEESNYEEKLFAKFYNQFVKRSKKEYADIVKSFGGDSDELFKIINKLSSKGVFPGKKIFLDEDLNRLKGDYEKFSKEFDTANAEEIGSRQAVQNELYKSFKEKLDKNVYINPPAMEEIFEGKCVNYEMKDKIFLDDTQDKTIKFVNEVYYSYIEYLLKRNMLNFNFMVMFAYLLLKNDENVRANNKFDFIMVDEFQDTDEIQFKLIMLLANQNKSGSANLCCVGDWKQGIYGFRNATIENIISFEEKINQYRNQLNHDTLRVNYSTENIERIVLNINYRSSKQILDASWHTLSCKGTKDEELNYEEIKELFPAALTPAKDFKGATEIKFYETDDKKLEINLILQKINELVTEEKYFVSEFDENGKLNSKRKIEYKDICVLSRDKKFGLELQREALKRNIPMNYEGGLEIFSTKHGILILAWLKLLLYKNDVSSWVPILESEGFTHNEITKIIKGDSGKDIDEPKDKYKFDCIQLDASLIHFLEELKKKKNISVQVEAVLKRYKLTDEIGNRLISIIQNLMDTDFLSLNDLVKVIEDSSKAEYNIELMNTDNSVSVMTIHKAKGLEFTVIIAANCNQSIFPSYKGSNDVIVFDDICGLRNKKIFGEQNGYKYVFNNWKSDLALAVTKQSNHDEERRLLYVASTRAKQYLYFTASKPSQFFTELAELNEIKSVNDFSYQKEFSLLIDVNDVKNSTEETMTLLQIETFEEEIEHSGRKSSIEEIKFLHQAKRLASGVNILAELEKESDVLKQMIMNFDEFLFEHKKNAHRIKIDAEYFSNGLNSFIEYIFHYDDKIIAAAIAFDDEHITKQSKKLFFQKEFIGKHFKTKNVHGKIFNPVTGEVTEI